jgi:hypothetical protein
MKRRTKAQIAAALLAAANDRSARLAAEHAAELAAAKAADDRYRASLLHRPLADRTRWLAVWLRLFPKAWVAQ